jgi:excisionase family DNA binding protein
VFSRFDFSAQEMEMSSDERKTITETEVPRLLTTKQLSEKTGIAYWRMLELVAKGKAPPHMRVGQTLRFPEDSVLRWIREQTNQAP